MSGGSGILALPESEDNEESISRISRKPVTEDQIELYRQLLNSGIDENEIITKYPQLRSVKEKFMRDRLLINAANKLR